MVLKHEGGAAALEFIKQHLLPVYKEEVYHLFLQHIEQNAAAASDRKAMHLNPKAAEGGRKRRGSGHIDYYWDKLSAIPEAEQCGWLKDQYGVSWQIVPRQMDEMMSKETPEQIEVVAKAFLTMKKFNLEELQRAYEEGECQLSGPHKST